MTDWTTVSVSPETVVVDIPGIGLQGPPGAAGPTGATGPAGGPTGATGPAGGATGAAGGDLGATYPNPQVLATHLSAPLPVAQGGTTATTAAAARTSLGAAPIAGVTDGSNAAAGQVGEYLTAQASAIVLTNNIITNVTTLALTAGDWDVDAMLSLLPVGGAAITYLAGWLSQVSATAPGRVGVTSYMEISAAIAANGFFSGSPGTLRVNISAGANVYSTAIAQFASGTLTANGTIRARRIR